MCTLYAYRSRLAAGWSALKWRTKTRLKKIIEHFNGRADYNLRNMYIYLKGLIDSWEIKRVSAQGMNGGADAINVQKRKTFFFLSLLVFMQILVHRNEQRRVKVTSRNILSIRNKRLSFYIFVQ